MSPCVLSHFSHVQLFVTPWTVPFKAPLSMGFSRQEHWSGLLYPSPGDLPQGSIPHLPASLALQVDSSPTEPPGKPNVSLLVGYWEWPCMWSLLLPFLGFFTHVFFLWGLWSHIKVLDLAFTLYTGGWYHILVEYCFWAGASAALLAGHSIALWGQHLLNGVEGNMPGEYCGHGHSHTFLEASPWLVAIPWCEWSGTP